MTSEELACRVLYRDALMIVLDKPAGMPVHEGPRNAQSRNRQAAGGQASVPLTSMFDQLRFGLPRRPELAHRLDRDTSGCLVLGRNRAALERLGKMFQSGDIKKTYWAVVAGAPETLEGVIDLPLGRRDKSRGWWMKVDPQGAPALTHWRVIGRAAASGERPAMSALALAPVTGRTHQLRVHCAAMGWPILGDAVYGEAERSAEPALHLHARSIEIPLYPKREPIRVEAAAPAHMHQALAACGVREASVSLREAAT
jgi:tRNA pseudouridine32 synthase/23S rRNA pseudouridine746 synthase